MNKKLKLLFKELEENALDKWTYKYDVKETNQIIRKHFEALNLPVVSSEFKEKYLHSFEEFLQYHCRKIDDYTYFYKGHEYWKKNLVSIYKELKKVKP